MLQQTTVIAVIPYFERFLSRFPTIHELAAAEEEEVLRLWEGLGYYSRARNLHKAARVIVEHHAGQFPKDVATLMKLPGIGRYTAGAIASFAFDVRAPIVEANTLRLYARLLGFDGDPFSKSGQQTLWTFAENILPANRSGQLNQATMELGATICSPRDPACQTCPVKDYCRAYFDGTQPSIPRPKIRPQITETMEFLVAIRRRGKFLLRRRPVGERWAGLWDFLRFELQNQFKIQPARESPESMLSELIATANRLSGMRVLVGDQFAELRHSVTRYRITLRCFVADWESGEPSPDNEWQWVSPREFGAIPFSVTGRKVAERLNGSLL